MEAAPIEVSEYLQSGESELVIEIAVYGVQALLTIDHIEFEVLILR
jgi:hypothetical protein